MQSDEGYLRELRKTWHLTAALEDHRPNSKSQNVEIFHIDLLSNNKTHNLAVSNIRSTLRAHFKQILPFRLVDACKSVGY